MVFFPVLTRSRLPIVTAMCLALLVPLFGTIATAQPLCLGDTVWDTEAEACVNAEGTPTLDEVPAEEPMVEPTVEATEVSDANLTVANDEPFAITLRHYYCDGAVEVRPGVPVGRSPLRLCTGVVIDQTINAYLSHNGQHWGTVTMAYNNAPSGEYMGFELPVPHGAWSATSDTPAGYGVVPVVACQMASFTVYAESDVVYPAVDPVTGGFDLPFNNAYETTVCAVHWIPTDLGATIDIVVYFCPADIENFHFRSSDSRRLACNEPVQDVGFFAKEQ